MRDFLKDTKDMYECRYGEEICRNFPRYGEFWSKYIGQRRGDFLKHYEIDSSKTGITRFDEKYENMTLAHYGIFVDLATVRVDFDMLLKNSYKTIDEVLAYWNSVRNIYSKIGDSIYKYKVFLGYAKGVLNIGKTVDYTVNSLEKDLESMKNKRDFVTHFTSLPFMHNKLGTIKKIPHIIYGKDNRFLPYSEILKQDTNLWVDVETQIRQDLKEIETKFNECHKTVLDLFEKRNKFSIIDPGPVSMAAVLSPGTSVKRYSEFLSSGSGMSGCSRPM